MDPREGRRKRLPRDKREKLILDEAVRFFSEVGFEGQTRALAERLGVTQPLLYRYFPDKESLIERVFDAVFQRRWNPEWGPLLCARELPLGERLVRFYKAYWREAFTPEWVRILTFAGLKGESLNHRHFDTVRQTILDPVCNELRHELKLPPTSALPVDDMEANIAWLPHMAVANIAIRKWIYQLPVPDDVDALIEHTVRACWVGCSETILGLVNARLSGEPPNLHVAG